MLNSLFPSDLLSPLSSFIPVVLFLCIQCHYSELMLANWILCHELIYLALLPFFLLFFFSPSFPPIPSLSLSSFYVYLLSLYIGSQFILLSLQFFSHLILLSYSFCLWTLIVFHRWKHIMFLLLFLYYQYSNFVGFYDIYYVLSRLNLRKHTYYK